MGGRGPGHKSARARAARLANIQKARAARKRLPLPWRSGLESRVIEQLIWQWWNSPEPRKWPALRLARCLGVSHTWVAKLVRRFRADPARMRRRMRAFAPATFETLLRAREETRKHRERGWLRGPIRVRKVHYVHDEKRISAIVPNESERRRAARRSEPPPLPPPDRWPSWACGSIAPAADAAILVPSSSSPPPNVGQPMPPVQAERPRKAGPIPFAVRRRRHPDDRHTRPRRPPHHRQ
jgi:hypothetical protein